MLYVVKVVWLRLIRFSRSMEPLPNLFSLFLFAPTAVKEKKDCRKEAKREEETEREWKKEREREGEREGERERERPGKINEPSSRFSLLFPFPSLSRVRAQTDL